MLILNKQSRAKKGIATGYLLSLPVYLNSFIN
jgi:hypothetical protein